MPMTKKSKYIISLINENNIDYWKTFLITLSIVFAFGILNIFYMIHNVFNYDATKERHNIDSTFESYLVDVLIDTNNEYSKMYPKNYAVNMRLGILYSYKKDYDSAERQFKNSIEKAEGYDYTPNYQLAKLYVKTGKLQNAQEVMDSIGEKPKKRIIRFKAEIYNLLGDAYYQDGYFALAVMKYERAYFYYDVIRSKKLKDVKEKIIKASVSLADNYVNTGKIDEAIMALEKAYELNPEKIIVNYKLGLLYIDNNPYKAYELLSYVHKNDPQKMNYDAYLNLINKLANIELNKGNATESELYRKRAMQYQKFVKNNLLYDKDLFVDVIKIDVNTDLAAQEYLLNFQFRLQNNSDLDIDNLYVRAVFKDGNNIIKAYTQQIFDKTRIFEAGTITPPIVLSASEPFNGGKNFDLSIDVYAYKYPKYYVKIYSQKLKKPAINR